MSDRKKSEFKQSEKLDRKVNVNVVDVDPITLGAIVAALLLIPLVISGFVSH